MASQAEMHLPGPPYPSLHAALGGLPTPGVDVPIASVFLVLYLLGAVGHMTIFQLNNRRQHKFIFSAMMFGFCMSRLVTMSLRISWAYNQHNVKLAIASGVFTQAGTLLLYVIDLLFAQRLLRATHPHLGWSKGLSTLFKALYASIPLFLAMVITVVIQQRYTLNPNTIKIDSIIQNSASCYLFFICMLPLFIVSMIYILPREKGLPIDHFGHGSFGIKVATVVTGTTILTIAYAFRIGVGWTNLYSPRSAENPGPYNSKACFWIFQFADEILVIFLYLLMRVDLRFHVPNGSKGSYNAPVGTSDMETEEVKSKPEVLPADRRSESDAEAERISERAGHKEVEV